MESLVHSKEKLYFGMSIVFSLLVYVLLIVSMVGILYIYIVLGMLMGLVFMVYSLVALRETVFLCLNDSFRKSTELRLNWR